MGFELWHISHIVYTFALFLNPVLHKLGVVSIYQSLNDPNVKLGLESLPAFPNVRDTRPSTELPVRPPLKV